MSSKLSVLLTEPNQKNSLGIARSLGSKNINIFLRCDLNITENDLSRIDMSIPTINKLLNLSNES